MKIVKEKNMRNYIKNTIAMVFINRETVEIYLEFCSAFRHLLIGFRKLFTCIVFVIPYTILTVVDLILGQTVKLLKR